MVCQQNLIVGALNTFRSSLTERVHCHSKSVGKAKTVVGFCGLTDSLIAR
jgi:hypothetical protein